MAAITMNTNGGSKGLRFLEDVTISNQTAASTAVKKGVRVPPWASHASFYIFYDAATGTSPTFDFVMGVPDFGDEVAFVTPTDATDAAAVIGNADWNGITQLTGAGPYIVAVHLGPDVTDDDTGSATASCTYGVKAVLPPVLTYTYTTTDSADDADYRFRIVVQFKTHA